MPTINDEEGLKTTKLTLHVPTADPSIADALEKDLGGKGVGSGWTADEGKPKGLQARWKDLDQKKKIALIVGTWDKNGD